MTSLQEALALEAQRTVDRAPKDFQPGIQYVDGLPDTITTPLVPEIPDGDYSVIEQYMPFKLPEGARLVLVSATFDPNTWVRESQTREIDGIERKTPATTKPSWRYRFKVIYDARALPDTDLAELVRTAKKQPKLELPKRSRKKTTKVINLGDLQAGKSDILGGTPELLQRLDYVRRQIVRDTKEQKPDEIFLADVGDMLEGFESAPNADRTNDLSQTQQLRLIRRVLFEWVEALQPLTPRLHVIGVPSNHCHVRRGKQRMGDPLDDYGIENIHAVSDICSANRARFKNVDFQIPRDHEEAVAVETIGGKILGFAHGDQMNSVDRADDYLAKQARGRTPVGRADILNVGHWHHLKLWTTGDDRWVIVNPTMDNGSAWHTNKTGDASRPGVTTYMVDSRGWYDLRMAWTPDELLTAA